MAKPVQVKALSILDVVKKHAQRVKEVEDYVKETGLCYQCKKNPVEFPVIRCEKCAKELADLITKASGPGFCVMG